MQKILIVKSYLQIITKDENISNYRYISTSILWIYHIYIGDISMDILT